MSRQRFYIIHGMGNDEVGLVGSITTPIASAGGNIVDLRQDVIHGLFTIYMVVDLTNCDLRIDKFKEIIKTISEDTGLNLSVDTYHPVARNPEKRNILMILIGYDKPGIIASVSQTLGDYKANIEFAQNIGREDIFLMELMIDVSLCSLPLENLMSVIRQKMSEMEITAIFQTDDVFNKKKRIILFDLAKSLIPSATTKEIMQQTGIKTGEVTKNYTDKNLANTLSRAAQLFEGLPADVINTIAGNIQVEAGTIELIQTLKIMGYKICLVTNGFSVFIDAIANRLGIIHSYGVDLQIDDDSRLVSGEIKTEKLTARSIDAIKTELAQKEQIAKEDITVVSDKGLQETPGIRVELNLETILDMYNKHALSKDNLIGLLGSLGNQQL